MWLTIQEVQILFGKGRSTVDFAIWRDNVCARKSIAGATWLVEYNSCVKFWGAPVAPHLVEKIRIDCNG